MEPLDAARALLPTWVRLVPWLWGPALGLLGAAVVALVARVPPVPEEPWWEKARVVYPVRQFLFTTRLLWVMPAFFAASSGALAAPSPWRWHLTLAAAWFPPLLVALRFEAKLQGLPLRALARSWAAVAVAGYGHGYFLVACLGLARLDGAVGTAAAAVGFLATVALASGGNLRLAQALGLARPADARVRAAVARVAARLQVPVREVVELDWGMANALAYPLLRRVAFTRRAVELLDDAEVEAVAAHELGHLNEPRWLRWTRPLSVAAGAALLFFLPELVRRGLVATLLGLGGALALLVVGLRARRRGEQHADAHAKDGDGTYARVLEKLYRANLVPPVLRRPGAHGHLYDRLVAAGQPPPWPRPAPPGRVALRSRILSVAVLAVAVWAAALARVGPAESPEAARRAIALADTSGWTWEVLGRDAAVRGQWEEAVTWYAAAQALLPGEPFIESAQALVLINAGRCEEARAVVAALAVRADLRDDVREALAAAQGALPGCVTGRPR